MFQNGPSRHSFLDKKECSWVFVWVVCTAANCTSKLEFNLFTCFGLQLLFIGAIQWHLDWGVSSQVLVQGPVSNHWLWGRRFTTPSKVGLGIGLATNNRQLIAWPDDRNKPDQILTWADCESICREPSIFRESPRGNTIEFEGQQDWEPPRRKSASERVSERTS